MAGILLLPLWVCAQGVNFRPLSYTEAIELAAKENKMVFIDFYTTWCGPCKRMSKEVFPQQEVGEYFNRTFISLKLDAEKENGYDLRRNCCEENGQQYIYREQRIQGGGIFYSGVFYKQCFKETPAAGYRD